MRQIALVRRGGGEPAPQHFVQPPGPLGGNLQPISQGLTRHLLPQDLIQGGEARLQLAQQALLATLLCLECFMARHTGLPRRIGFLMAGAGEREFRRQGIEGRLQVLPLPAKGPGLFVFQLEAGKPGLGLQLLQAIHLGAGLVEPPLQLAQLLLPLLLTLARLLEPIARCRPHALLVGK